MHFFFYFSNCLLCFCVSLFLFQFIIFLLSSFPNESLGPLDTREFADFKSIRFKFYYPFGVHWINTFILFILFSVFTSPFSPFQYHFSLPKYPPNSPCQSLLFRHVKQSVPNWTENQRRKDSSQARIPASV